MAIPFKFDPLGTMDGELPPGYTRCEYLQSTGTQYINTGIPFNGSDSFTLDFICPDYSQGGCVLGARTEMSAGRPDNDNVELWIYSGGVMVDLTERYQFKALSYSNTSHVVVSLQDGETDVATNGSTETLNCEKKEVECALPFYLFCDDLNQKASSFTSNIKIYSFSVGAKMKLVPALDPDGTPCMFDMVTKQPFYNKGTGRFKTNFDE